MDGAQLLAESRPQHRQIRLHAELGLDRTEFDLLHAHLARQLGCVRLHGRCTLHDQLAQRLPQLQAGRRARLMSERHDPAQIGDLVEERAIRLGDLGPDREVHGLGAVENEVAPEMVGEERHDRREHSQRLHERVPERSQRGVVTVPEAPARTADVPVGEIVDVRLVLRDHLVREVALV